MNNVKRNILNNKDEFILKTINSILGIPICLFIGKISINIIMLVLGFVLFPVVLFYQETFDKISNEANNGLVTLGIISMLLLIFLFIFNIIMVIKMKKTNENNQVNNKNNRKIDKTKYILVTIFLGVFAVHRFMIGDKKEHV